MKHKIRAVLNCIYYFVAGTLALICGVKAIVALFRALSPVILLAIIVCAIAAILIVAAAFGAVCAPIVAWPYENFSTRIVQLFVIAGLGFLAWLVAFGGLDVMAAQTDPSQYTVATDTRDETVSELVAPVDIPAPSFEIGELPAPSFDVSVNSRPSVSTPRPAPTPVPTPTPQPYCGLWIEVSDYCGDYNHVGNEWTTAHYISLDGSNYTKLQYSWEHGCYCTWINASEPTHIYLKTYISEYDDAASDSYTNQYDTVLDIDPETQGCGLCWTVNQWCDIVENGGRYIYNSCRWDTTWTFTLLYGEK